MLLVKKGEIVDRRAYRKARRERKRKFKKVKFYSIVAFLVILNIFGFKFIVKNKSVNEASSMEEVSKVEVKDDSDLLLPRSEHKDLGEVKSIIEYDANALIGAHYPVFGKDNIDRINKDLVSQYIEEFKKKLKKDSFEDKDYKSELSIDYGTFMAPNNMISIGFDIVEASSYLAHPDLEIVTKTYDLSGDKEIHLDDIMEDGYLEYISKISKEYFSGNKTYRDNVDLQLFKDGIYPSEENYSKFILQEDKIVFIFEKYQLFSGDLGTSFIEIAYLDLKDYIKPDLVQAFTEGKSSNKTELDSEKPVDDIKLPKRVVDPNKPMLALTFDDGPNEMTTIPILDALKKHDSVATFFVLGNRVSNNDHILKRILEEGSEIGNHSYNHKELTKVSLGELKEQIMDTQDAIFDSTGIEARLMRPTYGSYDDNLKSKVEMPLILWSVDTLDWQTKDAKKITDHVLANIKDGEIILMHDIYDSTAKAVELLVPQLLERGYQLVTVSELFEARGEALKEGEIYYNMNKK